MLENQKGKDDFGDLGAVIMFTNNTKTYPQTPINKQ
jgi:hypothetical protein